MRSRAAVKPLLATLGGGHRADAAQALLAIGDPSAADGLATALRQSQAEPWDTLGRIAICEALAALGDAKAHKSIVPLLRDPSAEVRASASAALSALAWVPASEDEQLSFALQAQDWEALGQAGAKALPLLILALDGEQTRDSAVKQIAALGSPAVASLVLAMKDNEPPSERSRGIAEALAEIGKPAVDQLLAALKSKEWNVRATAVMTLGLLEEPRAAAGVVRFLAVEPGAQSTLIATDAILALGQPAVEPLYALLAGKDEAARVAAAFAVGSLGAEVAERVAKIGRASKDRDVRGACAWVLETVGTPETQAVSSELLGSDPAQAAADYEKLLRAGAARNLWLLVAALERSGDQALANALLNSSTARLARAARLWARGRGFTVMSLPGG
jgi:HEAT repeat protein